MDKITGVSLPCLMSDHDRWKSQSTTVSATDETWQILPADVKAAVKANTSLYRSSETNDPRTKLWDPTAVESNEKQYLNDFCRKKMGVMFLIWLNQNNQGPVQLSTSQRPAKALKPDGSEADFHFQFTGCVALVSYDAELLIPIVNFRSNVTSHFRTWLRYWLDWTSWQVITSGHYFWHSPSVRMFTPVSMFTTCCTFMSRKNTVLLYLVRTPPARGKLFFVCRVTSKEILTLVKTCRGPRSFAASASDLKIVH